MKRTPKPASNAGVPAPNAKAVVSSRPRKTAPAPLIQEVVVDLSPVVTLVATFFLGLLVATPLAAVALVRMLYRPDVLGDAVRLPGPRPDAARSEAGSKTERRTPPRALA